MTLRPEEVTQICRAVAAEYGGNLQVLGVTSAEGGSERVELLVTIAGCHTTNCVLMRNLDRGSRAGLEQELKDKFREALATHAT